MVNGGPVRGCVYGAPFALALWGLILVWPPLFLVLMGGAIIVAVIAGRE